jgi:hypothetical protein
MTPILIPERLVQEIASHKFIRLPEAINNFCLNKFDKVLSKKPFFSKLRGSEEDDSQ